MLVQEAINKRQSIRSYDDKSLEKEQIQQIIESGLQAPSGKNGQPWKFVVVQKDKELLKKISALTLYDDFVRTADALIVVLLDKTLSYNYTKDVQAIGACIQNMLLTITDLGLGACWIGEILNRDLFVKKLLNIDHSLDLMAVIAVGHPKQASAQPTKKSLYDCLISWQ